MADMVACPDCRRLTAVTSRGNLWRHLCGGIIRPTGPIRTETHPNSGKPPTPPDAE